MSHTVREGYRYPKIYAEYDLKNGIWILGHHEFDFAHALSRFAGNHPDLRINCVHRDDSSGDTILITERKT